MKLHWLADELVEFWSMTPDELGLLKGSSESHRLGFALLLKFFQIEGYFPRTHREIPDEAIEFVAKFLDTPSSTFKDYSFSKRLLKSHCAEIRSFQGFRSSTNQDAKEAQEWLSKQALLDQSETYLLERLQQWYYERCIERPVKARQERIVKAAIQASDRVVFKTVYDRLSSSSKMALSDLLSQSDDQEDKTRFVHLKFDSGRPSLESVFTEIEKLETINKIALPSDLTQDISEKLLHSLYLRGGTESVWDLRRHPEYVGYSLLALYCHKRRGEIIDGLAYLLIQLIHKIGTRAKKKVIQQLIGDQRTVHGKSRLLYKLADAALGNPDGVVKDVLFSVVNEETLETLVKEYQTKGVGYQRHVQTLVRNSYRGHYRRMVPKILEVLKFQSNNVHHRPVIEALDYLKILQSSQQRFIDIEDVPVESIVPEELRPLVIESNGKKGKRINRIHYEVCLLQALRACLRCKEIWIEGANRYRNPDWDVPQDFTDKREKYYRTLDQPMETDTFIAGIQQEMREALTHFNKDLPHNDKVFLRPHGKNRIKLSPLEPQAEPTQLRFLKGEINKRWPMTSLLDVLKEAELRIGFTSLFKGLGNRKILDRETLQRRLLLSLYGLGSNTGLKRILSKEQGITYDELLYVKRRYIHAEPLRAAIAEVANAIFDVRQPHIWGEGTTACASDSKKFGAWDQNLMTE